MSVLIFPDSPVDGQLYPPSPIPGVNQYKWNASASTWEIVKLEDVYIQKSIIGGKGDIIVGEYSDVPATLTAGNDGDALIADSEELLGLKWEPLAAVATSGDYEDLINTPSIPSLSSTNPQSLGSTSPGTSDSVSRDDHVHPMPSAEDVGALPITFSAETITYATTVDLNMAALAGGYYTLVLGGDVTFTTSNRASGRTATIRLICDSTLRSLTFPTWVFMGTAPIDIEASKVGMLKLTFFGPDNTDCVATYAVQD